MKNKVVIIAVMESGDDLHNYIGNGSRTNIGEQTYNTYQYLFMII
jgi:hypothetical protein